MPAIRQLVNLRACSTGPISDVRDLPDGGEPVPIWCADVPVKPTIDPLAFASTPADFYGSSSAAAGEGAWAVYLHVGSTSHCDRSDQYAARLTVSPMQV